MKLDPFFVERLRLHRRYLLQQAVTAIRGRLTDRLGSFFRFGRGMSRGASAAAPAPAANAAAPAAGKKKPTTGPRAAARARHRRAALAWDRKELQTAGTPGPILRTVEHEVPVPGFPSVRVRIYYPDIAETVAVPASLYFFGGAFRIGGIDYPTTDAANRRRAADAGVAIAAVDYALAPEHRFPTQVEQGHAALVWLFENAAGLGIDPTRIGIAGTSAGGCIAAAVALANRDRTALPLRQQFLEVPVVDLTGSHLDLGATRRLGIPTFLVARELRSIARTYLPRRSDAKSPLASPLRAGSLEGLPDAIVVTAEYDPLRGDGEAYVAALREAGVDASATRYLGVTHDTWMYTGALPAARRWHADAVSALARLHRL